MNILRRRGQSTAEYAILIALIIGVAVAMQTYIKRGLQAGIKFSVDKVQKADDKGEKGQGQYEPYYLESSYKTETSEYTDTEETKKGGAVERKIGAYGDKKVSRSGYQKIRDTDDAD